MYFVLNILILQYFFKKLLTKLAKAKQFAKKSHSGQKRCTWEPYISHPLNVAKILKRHWFDDEILVIALLHDVCEDTECSNLDLISLFWEKVWFVVNALSKNKRYWGNWNNYCGPGPDEWSNYRLLMYINRLYTSSMSEPCVLFIKMADQLDNLSSISIFRTEKQNRIIEELENYYLPMYERAASSLKTKSLKRYKNLIKELLDLINKQKERIAKL